MGRRFVGVLLRVLLRLLRRALLRVLLLGESAQDVQELSLASRVQRVEHRQDLVVNGAHGRLLPVR